MKMIMSIRWLRLAALAALTGLAALLAGCATSWTIENDVTSYARGQGATAPATYRFERLPSQQAQEARQLELEAVAAIAMAKVGLQRDEQAPRYVAQINAHVSMQLSPWADPWLVGPGWGWGGWGYGRPYYGPRGWYGGYGGWGGWYGAPLPPAQTWYSREVSVVLRELPSNQVVYETRAVSDGPYADSSPVFAAMFQAAMQGYPRPLAGVRRVDVVIPLGPVPAEPPPAAPANAPANANAPQSTPAAPSQGGTGASPAVPAAPRN